MNDWIGCQVARREARSGEGIDFVPLVAARLRAGLVEATEYLPACAMRDYLSGPVANDNPLLRRLV